MKRIHLIIFLSLMLAIAQSLSNEELLTAETTSSSEDENANVNSSNEPAQNQKENPFNPFLSKTGDKGKEPAQNQRENPFNPFLSKTGDKGKEPVQNQRENPFNPFLSKTGDKGKEPTQNQRENPFNPFLPQKVDKGKEIKANKTPTEIEKSSSDQHPEIFFENPDFNFGMIYKGQKVEHIYKFENRGKDILKISKVKTSCGCTAAILTNKTVLPGETGEIKATFNSGSYGGNIKKTITVTSNDPNSPKYKLSISGEIKEEISVKPKSVNFGSIYVGKKIERTIAIKPLTDSSLNIKKITSSKEFIKASIAEKNKDGYIIKATLDNNLKIGRFSGAIFLETDNQRQPKVKIPFFGEVVGDITPYPKKIYYGFVNKGKEITRKVFVKINKDDIKILNIKISPDFLSTKIIEKNSPHYLIEVKLNKEAAIGKLNGLLELDTNSEKQPVIRIPILGEIKEAAIGKLNGLPELNTKSEKQPVKRTPVFGEG